VAQKITVEMTDDLDGSEADTTACFAVDGTAYEIDLSKKNATKLRQDFGRYIEHARKAARGRTELADAATWLGQFEAQFASCEAPRTSTSRSASAGWFCSRVPTAVARDERPQPHLREVDVCQF
jgi:hypothetical protein